MSQMTSRCENTVNTNIKRLNHSHFAKTTLEKGLAAFEQTFSARKPRSLLSRGAAKPAGPSGRRPFVKANTRQT